MPLCFWAAQTAVAATDLGVEIGRSAFKTYLPPHTAATAIQRAYRLYVVDMSYDREWQASLTVAELELERNMSRAGWYLYDNDNLVFSVSSFCGSVFWSGHLDYG